MAQCHIIFIIIFTGLPSDNSRELFCFTSGFFGHPISYLRNGQAAPRQKYIGRLILSKVGKLHSRHLANPSPKLYRGSKSAKFCLGFRHRMTSSDLTRNSCCKETARLLRGSVLAEYNWETIFKRFSSYTDIIGLSSTTVIYSASKAIEFGEI